jgi:predicted DNA-binding protein
MSTANDKKAYTVRLSSETKKNLGAMSAQYQTSESQIVETALREYFKATGFALVKYTLQVTKESIILIKIEDGKEPKVVHTEMRNGITPAELQKKFSNRFKAPVSLIYEEIHNE